jgi:hypothetical protein
MFASRKLRFGLYYGLVAGFVFSVAAWGLNSWLLAGAHFAYPWLTFLAGLLPALLICGLAGILAMGIENAILAGVIWLVTGILMGTLGLVLPLGIIPELLPRLEPELQNWVLFSWQEPYVILAVSAAIVTGIAFLMVGLLGFVLVDQASWSPYNGAIIMPLIICMVISGTAGGVIDNMANTRFRNSALGLERLFEFALQNKDKTIDKTLARQMHMNAVSMISADLSEKRRMFYFEYTPTTDQGRILVDLDGHWAICDMFLDQPASCQPVAPPQ